MLAEMKLQKASLFLIKSVEIKYCLIKLASIHMTLKFDQFRKVLERNFKALFFYSPIFRNFIKSFKALRGIWAVYKLGEYY